jgi:hypothetical protein
MAQAYREGKIPASLFYRECSAAAAEGEEKAANGYGQDDP